MNNERKIKAGNMGLAFWHSIFSGKKIMMGNIFRF